MPVVAQHEVQKLSLDFCAVYTKKYDHKLVSAVPPFKNLRLVLPLIHRIQKIGLRHEVLPEDSQKQHCFLFSGAQLQQKGGGTNRICSPVGLQSHAGCASARGELSDSTVRERDSVCCRIRPTGLRRKKTAGAAYHCSYLVLCSHHLSFTLCTARSRK